MLSAWATRWRYHSQLQIIVAALGLSTLVVFAVGAFRKAYRPGGYDVHCFLTTARAVRAGTNPYQVEMPIPYNYPLLPSTAAVPLTFLPESLVHAGWFLASLVALTTVAALLASRLARSVGLDRARDLIVPLGCASLLLVGAIQNHLLNGQTDAFVLLLCVLFWIDWLEGSPSRAAFWLGLAVSLKLVPGIFFIPLLLRRSWSVMAQTGLWIVVLSVVAPMLFLGTGVFSAYDQYARTVLFPELHTSAHSEHYPHSYTLYGALIWLVPACKNSLAAKVAGALVVLSALCVMEIRGESSCPWRRFARLEAYLASILLLAPLSQPHHLILLLPGVWLLGLRWLAVPNRSLRVELFELLPYGLFPLWKVTGGPVEFVAVGWLFIAALRRAAGPNWPAIAPPMESVAPVRRTSGASW
jgi:hypothetical protein